MASLIQSPGPGDEQVTSDPSVAVPVRTRPQRTAKGEGLGAESLRVSDSNWGFRHDVEEKALGMPTDVQGQVRGQRKGGDKLLEKTGSGK